jgi:hypothetical protein
MPSFAEAFEKDFSLTTVRNVSSFAKSVSIITSIK